MPNERLTRIGLFMRFARDVARRATCERLQVGCVLTDVEMTRVFAIGYNGNARGLLNACDRPNESGNCGCLHAEMNALLKADGFVHKVAFTTTAPCERCAKALVNANVQRVFYLAEYRTWEGLQVLRNAGVSVLRVDPATVDPPTPAAF